MNSYAFIKSDYTHDNSSIFRQIIQNEMKLDFRFNWDEKQNIIQILAYNIMKSNNFNVFLDRNSLVFQAGIEQHYSKPLRSHLIDRINLHILNSGDIQIASSVLILNPLYIYTIINNYFLLDNLLKVELLCSPEKENLKTKNNNLKINHIKIDTHEEVF